MIGKYFLCSEELNEALVFCFGGITEEFYSTNTDNYMPIQLLANLT